MSPVSDETSTPVNRVNIGRLLFSLPLQEKSLIRKLEKVYYKLNAAETAVTFNRTCINEGLLPSYTKLRLHDPSAADHRDTRAFRRRLIERQLKEKENLVRSLNKEADDLIQKWRPLHGEQDRGHISNALQQLKDEDRKKKENFVLKKLIRLNGGKLRLPQRRKNYVNLTSYNPDPDEEALLQLGLNCHLADKHHPRKKRLEIEILIDNLLNLEKSKKVVLSDSLRPLLLAEALTDRQQARRSSIANQDLRNAAKKLKTADGITVRRADKTPALVLINTEDYHQKLDDILADETKFQRIRRNPTDDIKREANRTIERVNALSSSIKLPAIKGDFEPGYIYGNVKTHKPGNPLRPIISQIPTPTYQLAKQLNRLLTPYIPS